MTTSGDVRCPCGLLRIGLALVIPLSDIGFLLGPYCNNTNHESATGSERIGNLLTASDAAASFWGGPTRCRVLSPAAKVVLPCQLPLRSRGTSGTCMPRVAKPKLGCAEKIDRSTNIVHTFVQTTNDANRSTCSLDDTARIRRVIWGQC